MPTLESNALEITTGNEICSINSRAALMPPDGAHLITATSATSFSFVRSLLRNLRIDSSTAIFIPVSFFSALRSAISRHGCST